MFIPQVYQLVAVEYSREWHIHQSINHWTFGIVSYGMPVIMESTLQFYLVLANQLCQSYFWGGATSIHLNSLGSIQWCCLTQYTLLLSHSPARPIFYLTLEELETLWLGMNLTVHRWSLMSTCHIDMTAHTPAFLLSWVPFIGMHGVHILPKDVTKQANWQYWDSNPWCLDSVSHVLSTQPSHHGSHLGIAPVRMVTHPSTNQAHDCLTLVIYHGMPTPSCQGSPDHMYCQCNI